MYFGLTFALPLWLDLDSIKSSSLFAVINFFFSHHKWLPMAGKYFCKHPPNNNALSSLKVLHMKTSNKIQRRIYSFIHLALFLFIFLNTRKINVKAICVWKYISFFKVLNEAKIMPKFYGTSFKVLLKVFIYLFKKNVHVLALIRSLFFLKGSKILLETICEFNAKMQLAIWKPEKLRIVFLFSFCHILDTFVLVWCDILHQFISLFNLAWSGRY